MSQAAENTPAPDADQVLAAIEDFTAEHLPSSTKKLATQELTPPLHQTSKGYAPESVYYLAGKGHYLIDQGKRFRTFSKRKPVITGVVRYLRSQGADKRDADEMARELVDDAEVDRAVDWCGKIAGYPAGLHHDSADMAMLITEGPHLPEPRPGDLPLLTGILAEAFPDDDARVVFLGWLKGAVKAVRSNSHQAAPMMVLAGPVKAGKSLIAWIVSECLGGRTANPSTAWSGTLPWNDDLAAAELLLIDDNRASSDIRDRRNLGARFKESIYAPVVQINKRNATSLSLRPVWRVLICCNETPDNLSVIPPLESDTVDKVSLLRTAPVTLPVDTSTPEGKVELQALIRGELPAFLDYLEKLEIPPHLRDSRAGVRAWQDPELLRRLHEISPEGQLEGMIRQGGLAIATGERVWMTAAQVRELLMDSTHRDHARELLKNTQSVGRYLSRLAAQGSPFITNTRTYRGTAQYEMHLPEEMPDEQPEGGVVE